MTVKRGSDDDAERVDGYEKYGQVSRSPCRDGELQINEDEEKNGSDERKLLHWTLIALDTVIRCPLKQRLLAASLT